MSSFCWVSGITQILGDESLADEAEDGLFAGDVGRDGSCSGYCNLLELGEAGSSFEDGIGTTFGGLVLITLFMSSSLTTCFEHQESVQTVEPGQKLTCKASPLLLHATVCSRRM